MLFISLVISGLLIGSSVAVQRDWIHTTLYGDSSNWNPPQLPCADGQVVLRDGIVFIGNGSLPAEIVMSPNSEIVFAANSEILLGVPVTRSSRDSSTCGPAAFSPQQRVWHNPLNWKTAEDARMPFIERVPCTGDDVVFPAHNSFVATLTVTEAVHSVTLKGRKISDERSLQSYLASDEEKGNFIYQNDATLNISTKTCPKEGCMCKTYDVQKYRDLVCSTFKCPEKSCQNKVKPYNDCCFHCGGIVDYEFDAKFDLQACQAALKTNFTAFVSRMPSNRVQILLSDTTSGLVTDQMLNSLTGYIKQADHPCAGKVSSITKKTANDFATDGGDGDKSKTVLAIVLPIFLLIIIIVIVVLYLRYRKNNTNSNPHKEFKNDDVMSYPGMEQVDVRTTDFMSPYDHVVDVPPQKDGASPQKPAGNFFSNPSYTGNDLETENDDNFLQSVLDITPVATPSPAASQEPPYESVKTGNEAGILNPLYDQVMKDQEEANQTRVDVENEMGGKNEIMAVGGGNEAGIEIEVADSKQKEKTEDDGGFHNPLYDEVLKDAENDTK